MFKYSLISVGIVLLAAASVAVGQYAGYYEPDELAVPQEDVQDWTEADKDLSSSDWRKKVRELAERDRARGEAIEAAKPKIRHDIMYDRTEPFRVTVNLEPYSDIAKFEKNYKLQGAEFLTDISTSGMRVTTEKDESGEDKLDASGKAITITRWRANSARMVIPPRVLEMLEADPAVHAVFDHETMRERSIGAVLSTEALVDTEGTAAE
jgi:hypothetical protein